MADSNRGMSSDDAHAIPTGAYDPEALRAELKARGDELIESAPDGIVIVDRDGRIHLVNGQTESLFGYPRDELLGRSVEMLLPEGLRARHAAHRGAFEADPRTRRMGGRHELLGRRRNGTQFPIGISLAPLRTDQGTVVVAAVRDVTERRSAEQALRESEERYRSLIAALGDGVMLVSGDGAIIEVNPAAERILGVAREELVGTPAAALPWRFVATDGRELSPGDRPVLRALSEGRPVRGETIGIHGPDGSFRWIVVSAEPLVLAGDPGAVVSFTNVTAGVEAAREQAALRRLATLVASHAESRAVFDAVARETASLFSAQMAGVIRFEDGWSTGVLVGAWVADLGLSPPYGEHQRLDDSTPAGRVAATGEPARTGDGVDGAVHPNVIVPSMRTAAAVATPIVVDGRLWGSLSIATTTTQALPAGTEARLTRLCDVVSLALASADAREQLATLASTDHLTGLPNRREFKRRLGGELKRARRHERRLSLLIMDLDHFKLVNDTHGHPAGDRVLIEVARRLAGLVREGELVARIGGEEFAVILPETDGPSAVAVAQRMRLAIQSEPFPGVGPLTVSGGACSLADARDEDDLFRLADLALYAAKAQGRNRIVLYSPEALGIGAAAPGARSGHPAARGV